MMLAVCAAYVVLLPAAAPAWAANEVESWNIVATTAGATAGQHPAIQPRTYAIVHLAIHDALNAIDRRYTPYLFEESTSRDASAAAAVAAAARDTLVALLPNQEQPVQAAYTAALAVIPEGSSKTTGIQVGQRAAALNWPGEARTARTALRRGAPGQCRGSIARRLPQTHKRRFRTGAT